MAINRITDSMMNYGFLSGMNKSLNSQYSLMEQMADGKRIHRPSDDPVRVIRSLQYRSAMTQNQQFVSNVKDAMSWMEITDQAMSDLSKVMIRAKELVVRAIAPNPDIAYDAAAKELDGLINQAIQIANTKIGDRYIFAGQMDKTQPFERVTLKDPLGASNLNLDAVLYFGDDRKISMMTQVGSTNPARDGINLTGLDVFGRTASTGTNHGQATTDVFNKLIRIKEELEKKTTVQKTNINSGDLTVDGHYRWEQDFQDFAVKIDALRVQAASYSQTNPAINPASGSLQLSYTGSAASMPTYPGGLQVLIEALNLNATTVPLVPPLDHEVGGLRLESTSNVMPVLPADGLQVRVAAVQVETGPARQFNPIGGALKITNNAYGPAATIPSRLLVRIPAGGTAVDGTVNAAEYSTDNGLNWHVATGVAGSFACDDPGNDIGLTFDIAQDSDNADSDQYSIPVASTGKVLKLDYSLDGWATSFAAVADVQEEPVRFTMEAASTGFAGDMFVQIGNLASNRIGDIQKISALTTDGEVSRIRYSTAGAPPVWQIAKPDSSQAGRFALGSTGFIAGIAANTNNNGGDVFTLSSLSTNGEAAALSYSTDRGNTWIETTPTAIALTNGGIATTGGSALIGGDYNGLPAYKNFRAEITAMELTATITKSDPAAGNLRLAYSGTMPVPQTLQQVRIDSVDDNGKIVAMSVDLGGGWVSATQDTDVPGRFGVDLGGGNQLTLAIPQTAANSAGDIYTVNPASIQSTGRPAIVRYSTDGDTPGIEAAPTTQINCSNSTAGNLTVTGSFAYTGLPENQKILVRVDQVGDDKAVGTISYSLDNGNSWSDPVDASPSGSGSFRIGETGLGVVIDPAVGNRGGDVYDFTFNTTAASSNAPYWPSVSLADGVTLDIGSHSDNRSGNTYSFDIPPYFDLGDSGVRVSVQPSIGNTVKDAYTFHMPQSDEGPDHADLNLAVGPDLEWLSAQGLSFIETAHEQILRAYGETGAKLSMYEMTATMLDNTYLSLVDSVAANEDLDIAKAIIDLKTAENSYKAALSFGARIMPTSLVDFLR